MVIMKFVQSLKAMAESLTRQCKCHGVSGSCSMKTCFRSLPFDVRPVAQRLRTRYSVAVHVDPRSGPRRRTSSGSAEGRTSRRRRGHSSSRTAGTVERQVEQEVYSMIQRSMIKWSKLVRYNHNLLCKISDKGHRLELRLIRVRVRSLVNGFCSILINGSFFDHRIIAHRIARLQSTNKSVSDF